MRAGEAVQAFFFAGSSAGPALIRVTSSRNSIGPLQPLESLRLRVGGWTRSRIPVYCFERGPTCSGGGASSQPPPAGEATQEGKSALCRGGC